MVKRKKDQAGKKGKKEEKEEKEEDPEDKEDKKEKTVPEAAEKAKGKNPGLRARRAKAARDAEAKEKAAAEDSEEEDDDEGEEEEGEAAEGGKAAGKKKTKANRLNEAAEAAVPRGVLFIGQIPDGFFEPQMKKYFSQFGTVTRLKLARSKKTGHVKGYGWLEFEELEVAQIVAQTMNKYMIMGKVLVAELIPQEKVPPHLFKNWRKKWIDLRPKRRKAHREMHNDRPKVEVDGEQLPQVTLTQVERREKQLSKLKAKLEQLGIEYDLAPFEERRDKAVAEALAERKRAMEEAEAATERAQAAEEAKAAAAATPTPKRAIAKQPAKAPRQSPAEVMDAAEQAAESAVEATSAKASKKALKVAKAAKASAAEDEATAEAPVEPEGNAKAATKKKKRKAVGDDAAEEAEGALPASSDGAAGGDAGQKSPAKKKKKKSQGA